MIKMRKVLYITLSLFLLGILITGCGMPLKSAKLVTNGTPSVTVSKTQYTDITSDLWENNKVIDTEADMIKETTKESDTKNRAEKISYVTGQNVKSLEKLTKCNGELALLANEFDKKDRIIEQKNIEIKELKSDKAKSVNWIWLTLYGLAALGLVGSILVIVTYSDLKKGIIGVVSSVAIIAVAQVFLTYGMLISLIIGGILVTLLILYFCFSCPLKKLGLCKDVVKTETETP